MTFNLFNGTPAANISSVALESILCANNNSGSPFICLSLYRSYFTSLCSSVPCFSTVCSPPSFPVTLLPISKLRYKNVVYITFPIPFLFGIVYNSMYIHGHYKYHQSFGFPLIGMEQKSNDDTEKKRDKYVQFNGTETFKSIAQRAFFIPVWCVKKTKTPALLYCFVGWHVIWVLVHSF